MSPMHVQPLLKCHPPPNQQPLQQPLNGRLLVLVSTIKFNSRFFLGATTVSTLKFGGQVPCT